MELHDLTSSVMLFLRQPLAAFALATPNLAESRSSEGWAFAVKRGVGQPDTVPGQRNPSG